MADVPPQTARDLERFRKRLRNVATFAPQAVSRSLNRGLITLRAQAARDVAPQLGTTVGRAKRRLFPKKSSRKKLRASLRASQLRLGARGRGTRRGVTIGKGAARRKVVQAWLGPKGYVLQRLGGVPEDPAGHRFEGPGRTRYPIQLVTMPSPAELWAGQVPSIMGAGTQSMMKTLDHELARLGSRR